MGLVWCCSKGKHKGKGPRIECGEGGVKPRLAEGPLHRIKRTAGTGAAHVLDESVHVNGCVCV